MTLLITSVADKRVLGVLVLLLLIIVLMKNKNFIHVILRMRWLFLSILLVYAFGTPGELIPVFPLYFAPTYEGFELALLQLARLTIALSALSLLLNAIPRQEMIAGLYLWLLPLKYLGLNVARFAARLTLTLHYVEALAEQGKQSLNFTALAHAHDIAPDSAIASVHLPQRQFSLLDKLILLITLVLATLLVYWNLL